MDFWKRFSPTSVATFLIIIAGALLVRLWGLGEYDFNDDELWHLVVANQDNLWDLIQFNFAQEVHPPLSFMIWHWALKISQNDMWLRMIGITAGLLLIPSIYVFGRLYIGRTAGYFLAFLFAFGAMPLSISVTIRAYSMMMLALTWAAIFAYRFGQKKNRKYLLYYFLTCLAAIELNHAAIFVTSALGLILLLHALREKNRRDFIIIAAIQAVIVLLVGGYSLILKNIYGFQGIPSIFARGGFMDYLMNYMMLFMWFPIGEEVEDSTTQIITLISFLSFFITPIALIKAKRYKLLILAFAPLLAVSVADYFRFYPFTGTHRNNLFLFLSVAITYAYFVQICASFFVKFWQEEWQDNRKYLAPLLQITAVSVFVFVASYYIISRNVFRNINPNCTEFSIKKTDRALLENKINEKDSPQNVFVTLVRNIWYLRWQYGDEGHFKILTPNLGKFENAGRTIYFTALPPRERSITENLQEYKLFFTDLFVELQSQGQFYQIKSFTFFDIGANIDYLTRRFHPQLIAQPKNPFMNEQDKTHYKIWQEGYDIGFAIHRSNQVLDKFYFKDSAFTCGREILFFSFTPKFVRDEIFNKDFVDARQFEKEVYSK